MSRNDPTEKHEVHDPETETSGERPIDPRDQLLVTYLDGELSDGETEHLEAQLATDVELRARLHDLQATWDMLDELPRTEPDRTFLKSTIEMVVTSAQKKKVTWHRWPLRIGALLLAFALASLLAFQMVRSIQNRPFRQFVADLDFLENVEVYDQIQDVAFLEALQEAEVFADFEIEGSSEDGGTVAAAIKRDEDANLPQDHRLNTMSAMQVSRLQQRQRAFRLNPPESQQVLRRMHEQILKRPDRERLLDTARAYASWLKTITGDKKYEIAETSIENRVTKVMEVREQQVRDYFGLFGPTSLPLEDVGPLLEWWQVFMEKKQDAALAKVKATVTGDNKSFERMPPLSRFRMLMTVDRAVVFELIEAEDFDELQAAISDSTAATLSESSLADQRKLVERWLQSASAAIRQVPDNILWKFYGSLAAEEKIKLDGLPRAELKKAIRGKYLQTQPPQDHELWKLFQTQQPDGGKMKQQNDKPRD